jgi:hypothetical protein
MRPAVSRFAERMEAELVKHEGEKKPSYTEVEFDELLASLEHHRDRLHWAVKARLRAHSPDELKKADAEVQKYAAHVGNYAMFIHDNAVPESHEGEKKPIPCDSCKHRACGFPRGYKGACISCSGQILVGGEVHVIGVPYAHYEAEEVRHAQSKAAGEAE